MLVRNAREEEGWGGRDEYEEERKTGKRGGEEKRQSISGSDGR